MNSMIAYHVIQDVKQDGKRSTEIIEKFDNSYTCEEIINILRKMNVRKVYDYGYIPNYWNNQAFQRIIRITQNITLFTKNV